MSNRTDFTLNDVRDYLIDTGAIREAEALLLGNDERDKPSNQKRQTTVINALDKKTADKRIEQLRSRQGQDDIAVRRENLMSTLLSQKHAGAMGLIREEEEIRNLKNLEVKLREENLKLAQERQAIAAQVREQKREQLISLEKQSEVDLLQLEMQRQEMEKNLNKKKMRIEKLQSELRVTETNIDNFGKKANNDNVNDAKVGQSTDERNKEMQRIATEHATKLADTRAQTLQAKKELENLNNGSWNMNKPNDSTSNNNDDGKTYELTENAKNLIDSLEDKSGSKIKFSDDGLSRQQRRVDDLKRQMNGQEEQFTKTINIRPLQVKGLKEQNVSLIPGITNDGTLSSKDYLEKWLDTPVDPDYVPKPEILLNNEVENKASSKDYIKKNDDNIDTNNAYQENHDTNDNPVIKQLQEEIKKMKEAQGHSNPNGNPQMHPNANPYNNPYANPYANPHGLPNVNPYGPPNPYGHGPAPFMNPYMPPHMNPFMPMMNPYMPPHMTPMMPHSDPNQQMMMQQIQKMAEQIERENSKLMGHLNGDEIPPSKGGRSKDSSSPIKRSAKLTRLEMQHEEEIRLMELEMEKIKKKQELEEVRSAVEAERAERLANDEHSRLVNEQKQQLQQIKLKQALLKEERILQSQAEKSGGISSKIASTKSNAPTSGVREDSFVGSKSPIDISLTKGAAILTDGLLLAKDKVDGVLFRFAVGFYDSKGTLLSKTLACPWTSWKSTNDPKLLPTDLTIHGPEIPYKRTMKQNDKGLQPGVRCMVEIQTKTNEGSQRSLGWGHLSFVVDEEGNPALMNGLWRMPIRLGIPDVKLDPATPSTDQVSGWLLLRVLDDNDTSLAMNWTIENSLLKSPKDILENYLDITSLDSSGGDGSPQKSSRSVPGLNNIANMKSMVDQKLQSSRKGDDSQSAKQQSARPPESSRRPSDSARPPSRSGVQPLAPIPDDDQDNDDDDGDDDVVQDRKFGEKSPWQLGTPTPLSTQKYQRGDGVDLYIDGAMFLPDSVSISRVVLKIVTAEKESIGNIFEGYSRVSGSAISPSYDLKAEVRVPVLNTTAVCLLRIDTLDSNNMQPCSVGYSVIKLFTTKEKKQPTASNDSNALLNTGLFQLPIYGGRVPNLQVFDENMLNALPKIPCATILVRIYDAPKSADGMSTLNKEDFSPEECLRLGLDKPAPIYNTGVYDGSLCEPTALDRMCYKAKEYTNNDTVEAILRQGMAASGRSDFPAKPDSSNEKEMKEWAKKLLPPQDQMRKTINFVYTAPYSEDAGLKASIEFLFNMPDPSIPPGLYYKDPPLTEGVNYTKTNEFEKSSFRCPAFSDGYAEFYPTIMQQNLYLLIDVRIIKVEPSKGPEPLLVIEPASTRKSFWTMFPLSRERIKGQGYKYTVGGIFQLPLIEGAVPRDIFSCENPMQEFLDKLESRDKAPGSTLKASEGCSVVVKVINPLLEELQKKELLVINADTIQTSYMNGIIGASLKGTSTSKADKFTYDPSKFTTTKKVKETLPSGVTDVKKFLRNVNKTFAAQCKLPSEP